MSSLSRFLIWEHIVKYEDHLDSRQIESIPIFGQHGIVYDSRPRVNWVTEVSAWIKQWSHWCRRGAALPVCTVTVPVDMPLIRSTKELSYVTLLATVMVRYANLRDVELTTHSLDYVAILSPFDRHHLLINFDYCPKATVFQRRF